MRLLALVLSLPRASYPRLADGASNAARRRISDSHHRQQTEYTSTCHRCRCRIPPTMLQQCANWRGLMRCHLCLRVVLVHAGYQKRLTQRRFPPERLTVRKDRCTMHECAGTHECTRACDRAHVHRQSHAHVHTCMTNAFAHTYTHGHNSSSHARDHTAKRAAALFVDEAKEQIATDAHESTRRKT